MRYAPSGQKFLPQRTQRLCNEYLDEFFSRRITQMRIGYSFTFSTRCAVLILMAVQTVAIGSYLGCSLARPRNLLGESPTQVTVVSSLAVNLVTG